jgi:hypothetical protein
MKKKSKEKQKKTIKDLSIREFKQLLEAEQKGNSVEISGVSVSSTTANLGQVKKVCSELIKEHSDYLLTIRESILKIRGYLG